MPWTFKNIWHKDHKNLSDLKNVKLVFEKKNIFQKISINHFEQTRARPIFTRIENETIKGKNVES